MNKKEVVALLKELGIPSHLKGYNYLIDSLLLSNEVNLLMDIYNLLAIKHKTTNYNIERSIRYAIEISYNRGSYTLITNLFQHTIAYDKSKPTNKEFIATLLEKLTY